MNEKLKLPKINLLLTKAFLYTFFVLLIVNIIGIIYQFKQTGDFMAKHPDGKNNLGIFLAGWVILECYILLMLFMTWLVSHIKKLDWLKLILLIVIFCVGIAPGVYFVVGVFLKK